MCGIAGAFTVDGRSGPPLDRAVLERMTETIRHRGPDDAGIAEGDGMSIGARRLSIVDVAGGHQPLSDESGRVWAAQNGEIFNHAELRNELRADGHAFRSRCDTEVLPHLYETEGAQLCERLHGMFGLAVWDTHALRGILARDRLGVKPLYYAVVDGLVVFGSELKSVIASGLVSDELDPEALAAYLVLGFVPGPMTPLKDVRKVMPGERLVIGSGTVRSERYWRYPAPDPDPPPMTNRSPGMTLRTSLSECRGPDTNPSTRYAASACGSSWSETSPLAIDFNSEPNTTRPSTPPYYRGFTPSRSRARFQYAGYSRPRGRTCRASARRVAPPRVSYRCGSA